MGGRIRPVLAGLGELLVFVVAAITLDDLVVSVARVGRDSSAYMVLYLLSAGVLFGLYVLWMRGVERRRVRELRLDLAWHFLPGLALGMAMFAAVMGMLVTAGAFRVSAGQGGGLLRAAGVFLAGATVEELAFRGILLRQLENGLGSGWALVLSALVFGLLHSANPHATVLSGLEIAVEGGLPLGAAYLVSGSLWLPIGLHFGWNLAEGGVFGASVSGEAAQGLLRSTPVPGHPLAGGAFGAEGSIVAVAMGALVGVLLLAVAARRGRLRSWSRDGSRTASAAEPKVGGTS